MEFRIILLTGEVEGSHLAGILRTRDRDIEVIHVRDLPELKAAAADPMLAGMRQRLIAFCTNVIVPAGIIRGLNGNAYNFHPGPPEYPGSHAASFAIYDGAPEYGVTAHIMAEQVDAGPIVGLRRFPVPGMAKFMDLEVAAYRELVALFQELVPSLVDPEAVLPALGVEWGRRKTTKQDFERMREIKPGMSETEIRRRYRAFG